VATGHSGNSAFVSHIEPSYTLKYNVKFLHNAILIKNQPLIAFCSHMQARWLQKGDRVIKKCVLVGMKKIHTMVSTENNTAL
jgi:hypothetical protein